MIEGFPAFVNIMCEGKFTSGPWMIWAGKMERVPCVGEVIEILHSDVESHIGDYVVEVVKWRLSAEGVGTYLSGQTGTHTVYVRRRDSSIKP